MKVIVTTFNKDTDATDGRYAGIRREQAFTSFSKLYKYLVAEYRMAKHTGNYIQVQTILK